jgi:hypothetical protein
MSRQVWIDQGQPVNGIKLGAIGITRVYFDARDTPIPSTFERGIYRAQSWDNLNAIMFAKTLSDDVHRWGGDPYKQLAVHANIELHDPAYIDSFLTEWRRRRPVRETALVFEGLQAGWFTTTLIMTINQDPNLTVLAEAYTGDMSPIDCDDVRSNLVDYGIARGKALVMYDAARLNPFWDGCAFTQQRLP